MRTLASYSFQAQCAAGCAELQSEIDGLVVDWLASKGDLSVGLDEIALADGRRGTVARESIATEIGTVSAWSLMEPTSSVSYLQTTISSARDADCIAVHIGLAATSETLTPVFIDTHCPRIVRQLLQLPAEWRYRETTLRCRAVDYALTDEGDAFMDFVWDPTRAVPVVAISDEYGATLHPGIVEAMARDLSGLAVVARLEPAASWRITEVKGREWSCYGGAIRLYWPGIDHSQSPYLHPLWTAARLLRGAPDTLAASTEIRRELRRRILGQSAFAISESPLFSEIRRASRLEEIAGMREGAETNAQECLALAQNYAEELEKAQQDIQFLKQANSELAAKVIGLQFALESKGGESGVLEPEAAPAATTVEEAVAEAEKRFSEALVFGADVAEGVATVADDAGPPEKVFFYLSELARMTNEKRRGPLGSPIAGYLGDRGVECSGGSYTERNNAKARQARTWDDGVGGRRYFDSHLKPNEATGPDRCVRIYFEYDEDLQVTIVGWVGRHP